MTGKIHPSFGPLTDATTMDVVIAPGWPFQPPLLLVEGLTPTTPPSMAWCACGEMETSATNGPPWMDCSPESRRGAKTRSTVGRMIGWIRMPSRTSVRIASLPLPSIFRL